MAKKSKAQLRRMIQRASARGGVYQQPPKEDAETTRSSSSEAATADTATVDVPQTSKDASPKDTTEKRRAAMQLSDELKAIDGDSTLRSKERRSAKRKAEAIAQESTGCSAEELLEWFEDRNKGHRGKQHGKQKRKNPYIVFVGQLSYDTTQQSLFQHVKAELGGEHEITEETVRIRLLTDSTTKKSRGMAFVELSDPELMYSCLKLHHTMLEGRRMNVERTAGGGRNSDNRRSKIKQYRAQQEEYMTTVVANMLDEYKKSGEIREGELDEASIALCSRHSAGVVQASLEKYIESNGRDMDNPSAYFSFLLGKLATEGVFGEDKKNSNTERPRKRQAQAKGKSNKPHHQRNSVLSAQGVDMIMGSSDTPDLSKIFPSMRRGRGRGRTTP